MTACLPGARAATVIDVELADGVPDLPPAGPRTGRSAWLLVRVFTEPVGVLVRELGPEPVWRDDLLELIVAELGPELAPRLAAVGESTATLAATGLGRTTSPFTDARARVLRTAPACTVVVCTRDRPDSLRRTLDSLLGQEHVPDRVLVVDNAPATSAAREVVQSVGDRLDVTYVIERSPGLSRARNHALCLVETPLVAWIDDDAVADRFWLAEIVRAFVEGPEVAAVSGAVVPLELETPAQVLFERAGGHIKGRGFTPQVFLPHGSTGHDPLYPLPPFGVGTNMAFQTSELRAVGGFDEALGAGTGSRSGEDTLAIAGLMLAGHGVAYRPSALVRHLHRRDLAGLTAQVEGYGSGLTAFYAALVLSWPSLLWRLVRLAPRAVRDVLRTPTSEETLPPELLAVKRRAMLTGAVRYLGERRRVRAAAGRTS